MAGEASCVRQEGCISENAYLDFPERLLSCVLLDRA